jgi:hypothetical protein
MEIKMGHKNRIFLGILTIFTIASVSALAIHSIHQTHKKIVRCVNNDDDIAWDI